MGSMSDHFNRTSVGAGAMGLLEHATRHGHMDVVKLLLGQPPAPQSESAEPVTSAAPPPAEVKTELGADMAVLKPANVRSRIRPQRKR